MLNHVLSELRAYMDAIESAKDFLKKEHDKYHSMESLSYTGAEERYNESVAKTTDEINKKREQAIDKINSDFEEAHKAVAAVVSTPVPSEAAATLEMIRARRTNLTEFEAKSILNRFMNNYITSVTLYEMLDVEHKPWGGDFFIPTADGLEERLNTLYGNVLDVLKNVSVFHPDLAVDFAGAILYEGDPIKNLVNDLNEFTNRYGDNSK